MEASSVSYPLVLRLHTADSNILQLEAELRYSAADPLAVVALFDTGEAEPVRWVFGRDLLSTGLDRRAGHGDVVVTPAADLEGRSVVQIWLRSPDGEALLEADAHAVEQFLASTWAVVPAGAEDVLFDLDSVLGSLFGEA